MHDAGGEPADGGEFFSSCDRAIRFDARRDVFAHSDDVRDLRAVCAHRNFADEPVLRVPVGGRALLLDALDLAGLEGASELAFERRTRLARQHIEDATAQRIPTRHTLTAKLAVAIPSDDAMRAINCVERHRQTINDRFGETTLCFCLSRASFNFARETHR